jgi:hypothetical protein
LATGKYKNGEVRDALLHVSDHGTPPDEATPDGTIPYRFNFLTQRWFAVTPPAHALVRREYSNFDDCSHT